MKCDYDGYWNPEGTKWTEDECQNDSRYELQYSVDWSLVEVDEQHPRAADFEQECCEEHIFNIGFIFNPTDGLPGRIYDHKEGDWRPDLVDKIQELYEEIHGPY